MESTRTIEELLHSIQESSVELSNDDKSIDVNTKGSFGNTPIFVAITWGDLEAVKLLINSGAEINFTGERGETPLHHAIRMGEFKIARYLVENGANTEVKDQEEKMPRDCCWEEEWPNIFGNLYEKQEKA